MTVASTLAATLVAHSGCGEFKRSVPDGSIELRAWVWDDDQLCWAAAPGTTPEPDGTVPGRTELQCDAGVTNVVAGVSRVAVAIDVAPDAFDTSPVPTVSASRPDGTIVSVGLMRAEGASFVGEFPVPYANTNPLTLEAQLGSSRTTAGPLSVGRQAMTITARIDGTEIDDTATRLAGVDRLEVCVCTPRIEQTSVELRSIMSSGEILPGRELSLAAEPCAEPDAVSPDGNAGARPEEECPCDCGPGLYAIAEVTAPLRPNTAWQIEARTTAGAARTAPVDIDAPGPLTIELHQPDDPGCPEDPENPVPVRTRFERGTCRDVAVTVTGDVAPLDPTVPLMVSGGGFEGTTSVVVGDANLQTATWRLPRGGTEPVELTVTATPSGFPKVTGSFDFAPPYPQSGYLAGDGREIVVSEQGTRGALIEGALTLPQGVRLVPAETELKVIVAMDDPGPAAPCGTLVDPELIRCDRVPDGGTPGGCVLTPQRPTVTEDGHVQLALAAGICVAGDVTFTLAATTAEETSAQCSCLGERDVTPYKLFDPITVHFVQEPTGSDGSSPSG